MLVNGAGYLTDGWSNSGNWELTFEFKINYNESGIIICSNTETKFDNNSIQINGIPAMDIRNGSTVYSNPSVSFNKSSWITAVIKKTGTSINYTIGSITGSTTWTGQSSISKLAIGNFYWGSQGSSLRNIKVKSI